MFNNETAAAAAADAASMPATDVVATTVANLALTAEDLRSDLRELLQRIELHVDDQHQHAKACEDVDEMQRLADADPYRWLADAKQALQAGMMYVDRALSQPAGF